MPRGGNRYELIRGVLVAKMPAGDPHGEAVTRTASLIHVYSGTNDHGVTRSGEPGYRLERDPDTMREPDVAWFAPGRIPEGTQGIPELAPDLAVEVKSPSNSDPEMAAKAGMWFSYGSQQVWVEYPERVAITVFRPNVPRSLWGRMMCWTVVSCYRVSVRRCGACSGGGGRVGGWFL